MRAIKQNTAYLMAIFMVDSTDHLTGKTGLTLTISAKKSGGSFATISPTVTERGNGWYDAALTSSHNDTLGDFAFHVTGTGADPSDFSAQVVPAVPDVNVATVLGVTAANFDGTAQAGTSTTITLASGDTGGTNAYVDRVITIVGGTGAGQSRVITAYNSSTKVATVHRAWDTNPNSTSEYSLEDSGAVADKTGFSLASSQTFNNTGTWTGNVVGTVSTVTTLTNLPAITTDWISAAGVSAAAVTKVQNGLATASQIPANFTAGTFASSGVFSTGALANAPTGGGSAQTGDVFGLLNPLVATGAFTGAALTNVPKTGYKLASDGLDSIAITAPSGIATTFPGMVVQLWRRFFKKTTKSATQIITYADNGTTVVTTQAITAAGSDESQGAAT